MSVPHNHTVSQTPSTLSCVFTRCLLVCVFLVHQQFYLHGLFMPVFWFITLLTLIFFSPSTCKKKIAVCAQMVDVILFYQSDSCYIYEMFLSSSFVRGIEEGQLLGHTSHFTCCWWFWGGMYLLSTRVLATHCLSFSCVCISGVERWNKPFHSINGGKQKHFSEITEVDC